MHWRRKWPPTPVFLPGESHGQRSLVGCSPWGRTESDITERLHFDFSLSCIGGGNGNPLQCSCLENPMDRGAWWAAVCGVTQSRTRLKRLSSSSTYIYTAHLYPFFCHWTFRLLPCLAHYKQCCCEHWGDPCVKNQDILHRILPHCWLLFRWDTCLSHT